MKATYRSWLKLPSRIAKPLATIVAIVMGLTTIVGVLWNLYEFAISTREKNKEVRITQLTTFTSFGDLLKHYRKIEQKTDDFLRTHRQGNWDHTALLQQ